MPRKTPIKDIQNEELASVTSPLRRSSRISSQVQLNSPNTPAGGTPSRPKGRRSSASDAAMVTRRTRRTSSIDQAPISSRKSKSPTPSRQRVSSSSKSPTPTIGSGDKKPSERKSTAKETEKEEGKTRSGKTKELPKSTERPQRKRLTRRSLSEQDEVDMPLTPIKKKAISKDDSLNLSVINESEDSICENKTSATTKSHDTALNKILATKSRVEVIVERMSFAESLKTIKENEKDEETSVVAEKSINEPSSSSSDKENTPMKANETCEPMEVDDSVFLVGKDLTTNEENQDENINEKQMLLDFADATVEEKEQQNKKHHEGDEEDEDEELELRLPEDEEPESTALTTLNKMEESISKENKLDTGTKFSESVDSSSLSLRVEISSGEDHLDELSGTSSEKQQNSLNESNKSFVTEIDDDIVVTIHKSQTSSKRDSEINKQKADESKEEENKQESPKKEETGDIETNTSKTDLNVDKEQEEPKKMSDRESLNKGQKEELPKTEKDETQKYELSDTAEEGTLNISKKRMSGRKSLNKNENEELSNTENNKIENGELSVTEEEKTLNTSKNRMSGRMSLNKSENEELPTAADEIEKDQLPITENQETLNVSKMEMSGRKSLNRSQMEELPSTEDKKELPNAEVQKLLNVSKNGMSDKRTSLNQNQERQLIGIETEEFSSDGESLLAEDLPDTEEKEASNVSTEKTSDRKSQNQEEDFSNNDKNETERLSNTEEQSEETLNISKKTDRRSLNQSQKEEVLISEENKAENTEKENTLNVSKNRASGGKSVYKRQNEELPGNEENEIEKEDLPNTEEEETLNASKKRMSGRKSLNNKNVSLNVSKEGKSTKKSQNQKKESEANENRESGRKSLNETEKCNLSTTEKKETLNDSIKIKVSNRKSDALKKHLKEDDIFNFDAEAEILPADSSDSDDENLDAMITQMADSEIEEDKSSESEDYEVDEIDDLEEEEINDFLETMAEEGEEDTPSDDSNEINEIGESIGSNDSERSEDEVDYVEEEEDDSFVVDDEPHELLPGEEYDLSLEEKRKSKIVSLENYNDDTDVILIEKTAKKGEERKVSKIRSRIIKQEDSSDEENENPPQLQQTLELSASVSTPNRDKSTSLKQCNIIVHGNISVGDIKDKDITKKITQIVDLFCSKNQEGQQDVSFNVALDYDKKSPNKVVKELPNDNNVEEKQQKSEAAKEDVVKENSEKPKKKKKKQQFKEYKSPNKVAAELSNDNKVEQKQQKAKAVKEDVVEENSEKPKKMKKKQQKEQQVSFESKEKKNKKRTSEIEKIAATGDVIDVPADEVEEKKKKKKKKLNISQERNDNEGFKLAKSPLAPLKRLHEETDSNGPKKKKSNKNKENIDQENLLASEEEEEPIINRKNNEKSVKALKRKAEETPKIFEKKKFKTDPSASGLANVFRRQLNKRIVEERKKKKKQQQYLIRPSSPEKNMNDWIVTDLPVGPSTSNVVTPKDLSKKFHPKDFKNRTLFDSNRKRATDKQLLKMRAKKGNDS